MGNSQHENTAWADLKRKRIGESVQQRSANRHRGSGQGGPDRKSLRRGGYSLQRGSRISEQFIAQSSPLFIVPESSPAQFRLGLRV
jgi:hypothetical protein